MNNVQDIEAAFDSQEWDQQMEQDLGAGRPKASRLGSASIKR